MPKIKSLTKAEFIASLTETCQGAVSKQDVTLVLDAIIDVCVRELRESGAITIPGIVKLKTAKKNATAERTGVSPFTKQPIIIRAKPATTKIKAAVVKALKEAFAS
jgi:nucleoid DNA-binding protein